MSNINIKSTKENKNGLSNYKMGDIKFILGDNKFTRDILKRSSSNTL